MGEFLERGMWGVIRFAVRSAAVLVLVGIVFVSVVGTSSAAFRGEDGKLTLQVLTSRPPNVSVNIGIVNPNGSGFRLLTNNRPGGAGASLAAWSPNGREVGVRPAGAERFRDLGDEPGRQWQAARRAR